MERVLASGVQVLTTMLEEDRTTICGPRYQHQGDRHASRWHGAERGGPRGPKGGDSAATGPDEWSQVPLPTFQQMASEDPLNRRVVEQMLVGVATRQYARSLEPPPTSTATRGTSKSAVSRRFVVQATAQLEAWRTTPLESHDLVALLIDGVHVADHCIVVALGIDATGRKHALGLWRGRRAESFALDPDRLARFKRDAHVLASLNHPDIGIIFGFEDADGVRAR
jgi:hypothetical protein